MAYKISLLLMPNMSFENGTRQDERVLSILDRNLKFWKSKTLNWIGHPEWEGCISIYSGFGNSKPVIE